MDQQFIELTVKIALVAACVGSMSFIIGGITAWTIVKWDNGEEALSISDGTRALLMLATFGFFSFGIIAVLISFLTLLPLPSLLDSPIQSVLSTARDTRIFEALAFGSLIGFLMIMPPALIEVIWFKLTGKKLGLYILGKKTRVRN
ncbi:MAG: hypothetical protein COB61_008560 [Thiotrichales bacterium]|nr:hypothetical protein [Thiotrichales bacterium]